MPETTSPASAAGVSCLDEIRQAGIEARIGSARKLRPSGFPSTLARKLNKELIEALPELRGNAR